MARGDLDDASLSDAERQLLEFVQQLTLAPARTTRESIQDLREAGWSDDQIAEAVYITGLFALFNRVADAFGLEDPGYPWPSPDDTSSR